MLDLKSVFWTDIFQKLSLGALDGCRVVEPSDSAVSCKLIYKV